MLEATQELTIIRLPECISAAAVPQLTHQFEQQITSNVGVIFDLSRTQEIQQEAAPVLLQGLKIAKQRSAHLSLMGVHPQVADVLQATGVLQHFRKLAPVLSSAQWPASMSA